LLLLFQRVRKLEPERNLLHLHMRRTTLQVALWRRGLDS
jgi:hypothetical protein